MLRVLKFACTLLIASLVGPTVASAATVSPGGNVSFTGTLKVIDTAQTPTTVLCTLNLIGTISATNAALTFTQANIAVVCDNGGALYYQTSIELGTATQWTAGAPTRISGIYHYTLSGFSITSESFFGPFSSWTCTANIANVNFDNAMETLTIPSTNISGTNGHTCNVSGTLFASPYQAITGA